MHAVPAAAVRETDTGTPFTDPPPTQPNLVERIRRRWFLSKLPTNEIDKGRGKTRNRAIRDLSADRTTRGCRSSKHEFSVGGHGLARVRSGDDAEEGVLRPRSATGGPA
jgi:hypothetical protein